MVASGKTYLRDTLSRKIVFFTGKGGVGKSTLTWATALACQKQGKRIAVATWNPYEKPTPPVDFETPGIDWIPLETFSACREYVLQILKIGKLYDIVFDNHIFKTFIEAAPGLAETVIAGKIMDLVERDEHDLVLVDLPSSGHTLSFFNSPRGIQKIFKLGFVHKESKKITNLFESEDARTDIVTLPEELPLTESAELKQKLGDLYALHFGYLHLNQYLPSFILPEVKHIASLPKEYLVPFDRYFQQREKSLEALKVAQKIHHTVLPVERLSAPTTKETIVRVSEKLEEA